MGHHLDLAGGAAPAREHVELAPRVAPGDDGPGGAETDPTVGDQGAQARPAQLEHRQQIVDAVRARRAVAEQQLHLVGAGDAEAIELIDVSRQLHEGRDARAAGQLGVLHDPGPHPVGLRGGRPHEEVGEAHELVGREGGLVDDLGPGVGERLVGETHRLGERRGVGRAGGGDLAHRVAEAFAVLLEDAHLVAVPRRAARSRVASSGSSTAAMRPTFASIARSHANSHSAAALRSLALQTIRASCSMYRMVSHANRGHRHRRAASSPRIAHTRGCHGVGRC